MKIIIENKEKDFKKEFEINGSDVMKRLTQISVFSFIGREVNRVRPPKRNIGLVFNWMAAAAVTDAVMNLIENGFEKKEEKPVEIKCQTVEEVKKDDEQREDNSGEV